MKYEVYFTIYGKKLKVTVTADTPPKAEQIVRSNLKIDKITPTDDYLDHVKGMLGIFD